MANAKMSAVTGAVPGTKKEPRLKWSRIARNWQLYLLILLRSSPITFYFTTCRCTASKSRSRILSPRKESLSSPWVGTEHFERFFHSYFFWRLIKNTLGLGLYSLALGFPIPILLALLMNEAKSAKFKKFVQTVTYAPHFLSTVVVVGMMMIFLSPRYGMVNHLITAFGGRPIDFMAEPGWFKTLYVLSDVWQTMGWSSIIYLAALAGVDHQLHEAARVDGAGRLRRIWHINLPGIRPTIVILLILNIGSIMGIGFEKVLLMQNNLNMETSDIIATYVYRAGIQGAEYSFSAAIGLFNSVVNFILLITVNWVTKRMGETSLW